VDLRVSSSTELHKHKTLGGERQLLTHLVEMVRPGDVVYDIGANIGLFTVIFAKAIGAKGRIIAFEPEEKAHRRLTENIQQNELATVEPFQFALGNQAGSLTLSADSEAASGVHSAVRATAVALDSTTQVVDVMTGDDFIAKYGAPLPNLIKLDVEGMEYDVLSGFSQALRSPICRLVVCEVHFSILESRGEPEAPAAIERLLRDSGFHVEWHDASHLIATKNGSRR
jgi:FkbM family methyltransferase